jgi:hypothetical protein
VNVKVGHIIHLDIETPKPLHGLTHHHRPATVPHKMKRPIHRRPPRNRRRLPDRLRAL